MLLQQLPGVAAQRCVTLPDGNLMILSPDAPTHPLWLELACYLGAEFRAESCMSDDHLVHEDFARYPDAATFYRDSSAYLYHLIGYWLEGAKRVAHGWLLQSTHNARCSILDYGCGIGCDGLWFLDAGYDVAFADVPSRSLDFLRWRLAQRLYLDVPVYEIPDLPDGAAYTFVWCTDVLEHLPPAAHLGLIEHLAALGRFVILNLIEDPDADGTVHHPVDVEGLTAAIRARWSLLSQDVIAPSGSRTRFVCYGAAVPALLLQRLSLEGSQMVAGNRDQRGQ